MSIDEISLSVSLIHSMMIQNSLLSEFNMYILRTESTVMIQSERAMLIRYSISLKFHVFFFVMSYCLIISS